MDFAEASKSAIDWLMRFTADDWVWGIWTGIKLVVFLLTLRAVYLVLRNLDKIREIVLGFKDARSPIWDLKGTAVQLDEGVKGLKLLHPEITRINEQVQLVFERLDAATRRLNDIQLEQSSTADTAGTVGLDASELGGDLADNWTLLRKYWWRNAQRLEYVISTIPDGRTRLSFDRMSRRNLKKIIGKLEKLENGRYLSSASAHASRRLVDEFNSYRSRPSHVPDEVVGPLDVVDRTLDQEIVPFANLDVNEALEPTSNQSGGFIPASNMSSSKSTSDSFVYQKR